MTNEELIALLRGRKLPVMGGAGVYEVVLDERPDALCAEAADALETLIAERDALAAAMEAMVGAHGRRDVRTSELLPPNEQPTEIAEGMRALNPEQTGEK